MKPIDFKVRDIVHLCSWTWNVLATGIIREISSEEHVNQEIPRYLVEVVEITPDGKKGYDRFSSIPAQLDENNQMKVYHCALKFTSAEKEAEIKKLLEKQGAIE